MSAPSALRLPDGHPIRSARWIWPAPMFELVNGFAEAATDVVLEAVPERAPFAITADQHYRLWVNGAFVCRGPARGYQRSWPVDEVDLAPFLRPGSNRLAVELYNPGVSTFRYLHQGMAGLLCAGDWGAVQVRSGAHWRLRRSPAHRTATRRLSMQLDFQEHLDLARLDRRWIEGAAEDGPWGLPEPIDNSQPAEVEPGAPPWEDLEARGILLLGHRLLAPAAAVAAASGPCGEGWTGWSDASWPWQREAEGLAWTPAGPGRQEDGRLAVELPAAGAGRFAALAVDVGEYVCGNLLLEVDGGSDGAVLDLHYHERLVDGRPDRRPPGVGCCVALASRLHLAPGRHALELYHLLGFRVVTLVARGTGAPLRVRLRVRTAAYPFALEGRFACGDDELEAIHAACRRTQVLCSGDAYVDTPWREQAQWWGDARIQARTTFRLDPDARLLARGIRSIAGQAGPGGLTYGHAPTVAHNCILPDFSLTWIMTLWDHYWQTGSTELVRELWPRVEAVLGSFDGPDRRDPDGLLRHDRRLWYFGDWADLHRGEVPTLLNLWYLLALRLLARLLAADRRHQRARRIADRADAHERAVLDHLFDAATGLFRAGRDGDHPPGVHEQAVAILLGLVPDRHRAMLDARLLPWVRGEAVAGSVPSASWATHAFDALARHGHVAEVVAAIRRGWRPMLATGTTWGGYTWDERLGGSASHAWTAHPAAHLVDWLAGLRQTAPAWTRVVLEPAPVPGIDRAEALVPTPQGPVRGAWRRIPGGLRIELELPPGTAGEIRWAGVRPAPAGRLSVVELPG